MKIKTVEQYKARYDRRAPKAQKQSTIVADMATGLKPNHKARAQKLEDVFAGMYMPKASKDKISGLPLMGDWQGCAHSLSYWQEDADEKGRPIYFGRAMPCTVNHGWKDGKHGIVPDMGKKGDHIDKIGRRW